MDRIRESAGRVIQLTESLQQPENNPSRLRAAAIADRIICDIDVILDELGTDFDKTNDHVDSKVACFELVGIVASIEKVTNDLITAAQVLFEENAELQGKAEQLEGKIHRLEAAGQKLVVGEIAFTVEEKILSYVMKPIAEPNERSLRKIRELEKAIAKKEKYEDVFSCEEERKIAEDRLQKLKSIIGWKFKHYRDLERLKDLRVRPAHPVVSHEVLKEVIAKASGLEFEIQKICNSFLHMLDSFPIK